MSSTKSKKNVFESFSSAVSKKAGSTPAFVIAVCLIIGWLASGPLFDYSDTWQLVINTTTTIITFLMVFLIQRSQNKEALAIQIKLNELIASSQKASNRLIDAEGLSEDELHTLESFFKILVEKSKRDKSLHQSHSIEEAGDLHKEKKAKK
jgi:low affinity Fe/Cu permease